MAEAEEDPPATSWGSDLKPPVPPALRLSSSAPLEMLPGMEKKVPYMGDVWVIGTGVGTAAISVCPFTTEGLGQEDENAEARCPSTIAGGSPLPWRTTWCGSPLPPAASTLGSVPAASFSHAHPSPVRCSGLQWRCTRPPQSPACKPSSTAK